MDKCDLCNRDMSSGVITHTGYNVCVECANDIFNILNELKVIK